MSRRGFTLLEVTLATFIASMMLFACLGLFATLNRQERVLSGRFHDTSAFERTHLVVQRSMELLLMAQVAEPKPPSIRAIPEIENTQSGTSPPDPGAPARFMLQADPSAAVAAMPAPDVPGNQIAEGSQVRGAQRLEVVLLRHPATPALRGRTGRAILGSRRTTRERAREDERERGPEPEEPGNEPESDVQAVRGAFELRPTVRRSRDDPAGYTLWWQPLERSPDPEAPAVPSALAPVELVRGLRWAKWSVYQAKEWREQYQTSYVENLPAYVALKAKTVSGYYVDWLFEIKWLVGPEFAEPEEPGIGGAGERTGDGAGARRQNRSGGAAGEGSADR